jgi:hypothetical protein
VVRHLVGLEARERRLQVGEDEPLAGALILDDRPQQASVRVRRQSRCPPPDPGIGMPIIVPELFPAPSRR